MKPPSCDGCERPIREGHHELILRDFETGHRCSVGTTLRCASIAHGSISSPAWSSTRPTTIPPAHTRALTDRAPGIHLWRCPAYGMPDPDTAAAAGPNRPRVQNDTG